MVRATSRGDGGEGELICRQGRAGIHEPVDGYIMWINRASPTCVDAGDGPGRGGGPMPVGFKRHGANGQQLQNAESSLSQQRGILSVSFRTRTGTIYREVPRVGQLLWYPAEG